MSLLKWLKTSTRSSSDGNASELIDETINRPSTSSGVVQQEPSTSGESESLSVTSPGESESSSVTSPGESESSSVTSSPPKRGIKLIKRKLNEKWLADFSWCEFKDR